MDSEMIRSRIKRMEYDSLPHKPEIGTNETLAEEALFINPGGEKTHEGGAEWQNLKRIQQQHRGTAAAFGIAPAGHRRGESPRRWRAGWIAVRILATHACAYLIQRIATPPAALPPAGGNSRSFQKTSTKK